MDTPGKQSESFQDSPGGVNPATLAVILQASATKSTQC